MAEAFAKKQERTFIPTPETPIRVEPGSKDWDQKGKNYTGDFALLKGGNFSREILKYRGYTPKKVEG